MNLLTGNKQKKISLPVFLILAVIMLIIMAMFNSCKNKKTRETKLYTLRVKDTIVRKWLKAPKFRGVILQFYTSQLDSSNDNMELIGYTVDSPEVYTNPYHPDVIRRQIDSFKVFHDTAVFGNNSLSKQKILRAISDSRGNILSFDYLIFKPILKASAYWHVAYRIYAVGVDGKRLKPFTDEETNPCPRVIVTSNNYLTYL